MLGTPLLNLRFFIETGMEMSQPCTPKCLRVVGGSTRALAVGKALAVPFGKLKRLSTACTAQV